MTAPPNLEVVSGSLKRKAISWWEILIVLLFGYAPSAVSQAVGTTSLKGPALPIYECCSALTFIALLLYVVWIRDGSLKNVGIVKGNIVVDVLLGGVLCYLFFVGNFVVHAAIPQRIYEHWYSMGHTAPVIDEVKGRTPLWMIFPPLLAVNSFEEFLMRGYLTGRLIKLFSSPWLPILISSAVFASWHFYEGPLGVINAFMIGLVLGTCFAYTRRIWPLIVAHFAYDAILTLIFVAFSQHSHRL